MTYDELVEKVRSAWQSRIILTAVELGVPDALALGAARASEVARRLGTDARGTELLLYACVPLGLVAKTGERFSNSPLAEEYLVRDAPTYRGSGLRHHANLWKSWSGLTDVVRAGRPEAAESERPRDEYHDYVRAMYDFGWERAQALAQAIDLSGVSRMLDLGGGPGSFAVAFCARNPEMEAVVLDKPPALEVAAEIVERHGQGERVKTKAGDFLTDDIGHGYDLVLVSQIIHSFGEKQNRLILGKASDALTPGGMLVLMDFFLEDDRASPPMPAIFAINMLVNTAGGRTYTWSEVEAWLGEIGFGDIRRQAIPGPAGVILARKSG